MEIEDKLLSIIEETPADELEKLVGSPEINYGLTFEKFLEAEEEYQAANEALAKAKEAWEARMEEIPEYQAMVKAELAQDNKSIIRNGWKAAVQKVAIADYVTAGTGEKQYRGGHVQVRERVKVLDADIVRGYLLMRAPDYLNISLAVRPFERDIRNGTLKNVPMVSMEKEPIFVVESDLSKFLGVEETE